jgi:hypothetical protein
VVSISVATAVTSRVAAITPALRSSNAFIRSYMATLSVLVLAWEIPTDHQHDAELSEGMGKGQDRGGQDARPGEGHFDSDETLPRCQATARGRVAHVGRDRFKAALDRLDNKRNVRDRRCQQ